MDNRSSDHDIKIRTPRMGDIAGIVELVNTGKPYLSAHGPYLYWIYINFWRDTCAVAELDGEIIGWCSIIPVSGATYLCHQLGVVPHARRLGLGKTLFLSVLDKLKARHTAFAIEFTVDRRNRAALDLDKAVAAEAGMELTKKPDTVPALEGSEEELYVMTRIWQPSEIDEASQSPFSEVERSTARGAATSERWRATPEAIYTLHDHAKGAAE
jgi:L-2,4-diaminobutyric acid acetyltransferase